MFTRKFTVNSFLLLFVLIITGCQKDASIDDKSVKLLSVETIEVAQSHSYTVRREYAGQVRASQRANLGFELSGKIAQILVDAGDKVELGQPLISLDTQLLIVERQQLDAQIRETKAQLKLTQANLKRQRSLQSKGFSSKADIESLESQKEALQANHQRIQAALAANLLQQQKSVLKAPYTGVVSERFVSLGDVVSAGTPTFSLLSSGDKEAVIGIYKGDVQYINGLSKHKIRVNGTIYHSDLVSFPTNIDTHSRNIRLRFMMENSAQLLDGELAYLQYDKEINAQGFWLPITALTDGIRGTWNVYAVSNVDHQTVELRTVEILYSDNERVYVQGALSDGDKVIATGLQKVVPGQKVQIVVGDR